MCLKINTTSKFFVSMTYKKIRFIIHPEYFDANNIFSHPCIHNLKHKPNIVQHLSRQMKKGHENRIWVTLSNSKYTIYNASLVGMVKHNTVDGRMRKTKLHYNQVS